MAFDDAIRRDRELVRQKRDEFVKLTEYIRVGDFVEFTERKSFPYNADEKRQGKVIADYPKYYVVRLTNCEVEPFNWCILKKDIYTGDCKLKVC